MDQTNRDGRKHNGLLEEESLEEIISWGSPISPVLDVSQEDMISSKKTLDFLDDDDGSVEQDFGKEAMHGKKADHLPNGFSEVPDHEKRDLKLHQSLVEGKLEQGSNGELNAALSHGLGQDNFHAYSHATAEPCNATVDKQSNSDDRDLNQEVHESDDGSFNSNHTNCHGPCDLSNLDGEDFHKGKINQSRYCIQDDSKENNTAYISSDTYSTSKASEVISEPYYGDLEPSIHNSPSESDHSSLKHGSTSLNEFRNSHIASISSLKDIFEDEEESSQDFFGKNQTLFDQGVSKDSNSQDQLVERVSTGARTDSPSRYCMQEDNIPCKNRGFTKDGLEFVSSDEFECVSGTIKDKELSTSAKSNGASCHKSSIQIHSDGFNELPATESPLVTNDRKLAQVSVPNAAPGLSEAQSTGSKTSRGPNAYPPTQSFESSSVYKPTGTRAIIPEKSSSYACHPIVKFCGETLLVYTKASTKRYLNTKVAEKSINTFYLYRPNIPTISEDSFRDKTIFRVLSAKYLNNDYSKISSLLGIEEKMVFDSDISIVISSDFLNSSFVESGHILDSAESISKFIRCSNENTREILKFKMGLVNGENLKFEPGNLYQVISSKDKRIIKSFILSQKNIMLFFALFYKLGLAELEDYRHIFHNNIYHQYILSRLGIAESFPEVRQPKNGWNIMNVVDFGISKILNIEQAQSTTKPNVLDKLICEKEASLTGERHDGAERPLSSPIPQSKAKLASISAPIQNMTQNRKADLLSHGGFSKRDKQPLGDSPFLDIPQKSSSIPQPITEQAVPDSNMLTLEPHSERHSHIEDKRPSPEPSYSSSIVKTPNSGDQDKLPDNLEKSSPANSSKALFDDSDDDFEVFESPSMIENPASQGGLSQKTGDDALSGKSEGNVASHIIPAATSQPIELSSHPEIACEGTSAKLETSGSAHSGEFEESENSKDGVYKHPNVSFGSISSLESLSSSNGVSKPEKTVYKTGSGSRSSSNLEHEEDPGYKKKFSKSFADIFMLEGDSAVSGTLDVSSYVPEAKEGDKPLMQSYDESDSKSSVISSLFGFFKKKQPERAKAKDDPYMNRLTRPLKAEIKVPEKERRVIHSSYANKKQAENFEIPGFKQPKK